MPNVDGVFHEIMGIYAADVTWVKIYPNIVGYLNIV